MPITPTYPGVYVEEIPSGVRTITGVSTSVAAFVDYFQRGPMNEPVQIFNLGDFQREFGGLDSRSEASYAIQQFFLNGGTEAWAVRTASGAVAPASVQLLTTSGGATALTVTAISPGQWGNHLRVSVDYPQPASNNRFNLTVSLFEIRNGAPVLVTSEVFRNLSMTATDSRFANTVVNDRFGGSKLVRVAAAGGTRPQQTGTLSGVLAAFPAITAANPQVNVAIGTEGPYTARLGAVPASLTEARALLEAAIRGARPASRAFAQASVAIVDGRLRVLAGPSATPASLIVFTAGGTDTTAQGLGLAPGVLLDGVMSDMVPGGVFPIANGAQLDVSMGAGPPQTLALNGPLANLAAVAAELETQIRAADPAPEFADARVLAHTDPDDRLIVLAGVSATAVTFTQTGADTTFSDLELDAGSASAVTARVSTNLATVPTLPAGSALDVTLGATGPARAVTAAAANTLAGIARELQAGIRAADAAATFAGARVGDHTAGGENRLVVLAGTAGDVATLATAPVDITTVNQLRLDAGTAQSNVQAYTLGNAAAIANTAQGAGVAGNDGDPPDATALIGDLNAKTGLFALEDVDLFNILCIPRTATVSGNNSPLTAVAAGAVITAAINYCEQRRAFFIVDTPSNVDEVQEIKDWLDANATLRHRNAALYFPRVQIPDPLDGFRLRAMGAGGTMAGLYARTDGSRGVWKAPAGIEAGLTNVQRFDYVLSDAENGTLNPLGINALRSFPVYGNVAWGGRTLDGADQQASEWKYIPVRRLALFLEESLYRGLQWVVFEPNDEPLWAQIRLNVGAFMHNLFRQGAFQGTTPRQAYLVKCDAETTTQNDIDRGIVNILVGFAPLKPAEFVIIQIQQLAGQVQT